jgi:hypothetical protein
VAINLEATKGGKDAKKGHKRMTKRKKARAKNQHQLSKLAGYSRL